MAGPIHLRPTSDLAERVLLPGDPGRALLLAQSLLDRPRMFNHNRGLWGYTGTAGDGAPLTIQSTGMGGPSTAIVISELAELGARRLVRVGTCGALAPGVSLGELVIAVEAIAADGTSRSLGAEDRVPATRDLLTELVEAGGAGARAGAVVSTDLFYDARAELERRWIGWGALAVEMETATLYALAASRGLQAGAVLVVSDLLVPTRVRISPPRLRESELRMGRLALAAVAADRAASPVATPIAPAR